MTSGLEPTTPSSWVFCLTTRPVIRAPDGRFWILHTWDFGRSWLIKVLLGWRLLLDKLLLRLLLRCKVLWRLLAKLLRRLSLLGREILWRLLTKLLRRWLPLARWRSSRSGSTKNSIPKVGKDASTLGVDQAQDEDQNQDDEVSFCVSHCLREKINQPDG